MARAKPVEKQAEPVVVETQEPPASMMPGDVALVMSPEATDYLVTHLHVRAARDGFRRCGRAWPAAGVTVAVDEFGEDEIERLLNDPDLLVTPVCDPQPTFDGV